MITTDGGKSRTKSPRERFKKIAPERLGSAEKALDLLKQFANPAVYDVTPGEKAQLVAFIREKADELEFVLNNNGKPPARIKFEDEA